MTQFKYTNTEKDINKIFKYNCDLSEELRNDKELCSLRNEADERINSSVELLKTLGYEKFIDKSNENHTKKQTKILKLQNWEDIVKEANEIYDNDIIIEDLLTKEEIEKAYEEREEIERKFSDYTGICNKTDLKFLIIAIGLQVAKVFLFPYIAKKYEYGESFDKSKRLAHDDKTIKTAQKEANNQYKKEKLKNHKNGYWINILYQPPAYDTINGSKKLGLNISGTSHRLYTLGHDPILGWIFGTANILTDVITFNDFRSFRVVRKPKPMHITKEKISIIDMFQESYQTIKDDYLNLPAAVFAQYQHLKSDVNTKMGLPVPIISTFNEQFASKLYSNQYDALCFERDLKIVGASFFTSLLIDMVIGLVHGLYRKPDENKDLYEVRTRKILLISNSIATSSTILNTYFTKNKKNLDIGSVFNTLIHLLTDIRFLLKIKDEFTGNEINKKLQSEIRKIEDMYNNF